MKVTSLLLALSCAITLVAASYLVVSRTPFEVDDSNHIKFRHAGWSKWTTDCLWPDTLRMSSTPLGAGPLSFVLSCESVFLRTRKGTDVWALRPLTPDPESITFCQNGETIHFGSLGEASESLLIRPGALVPGYDCHGLTFARSEYIIDNSVVAGVLEKDYVECAEDSADVVIYYKGGSVVHSAARLLDDGRAYFLAKGGVRDERRCGTPDSASCSVPYDVFRFFRQQR